MNGDEWRWLRGVGGRLRRDSSQAARLGSRLWRTGDYLWNLMVWSRVMRNRRRPLSHPISAEICRHRGIASEPPRLDASGTETAMEFAAGFNAVYPVLLANLNPPGLLSSYRHAQPGPAFRGIYLWDSAFIAQIWKYWDPSVAKEVVQSVIEFQTDGRLPHVVADFVRSSYTQPPLLAWSACELLTAESALADGSFVELLYGRLVDCHCWFERRRRLPNGLFFWCHPYESGVENAPRFSNRDESNLQETRHLAAPDLASYLVLQCEALSALALRLGRDDEAVAFLQRATELKTLCNEQLWCAEQGLYFDRDWRTQHFVQSATIASLLPLWAGIPTPARADQLRAHLTDVERFNTQMPLPSVSRHDPDFCKDMWRGPVWINTAFGVLAGCRRYGWHAEAGEMAFRICEVVYRVFVDEGFFYEFYDPEAAHSRDLRRKQGNWWKALTLGRGPQRDFVGWTGLVNNMMIELVFGIRLTDGELQIQPYLPAAADGIRWTLQLPCHDLKITLQRRQRVTDVSVEGPCCVARQLTEGQSLTLSLAAAR